MDKKKYFFDEKIEIEFEKWRSKPHIPLQIYPVRMVSLSLELEMCVVATRVMKYEFFFIHFLFFSKIEFSSKRCDVYADQS